jgi:HSP20 family protein
MMTMRRITLDPFNSPARRFVDQMFDTFVSGLGTNGEPGDVSAVAFTPPVNIWESDNAIVVECELPGFAIGDLDIAVLKNQLTLSGTRQPNLGNVPENARVLRRERAGLRFERIVALPAPVDSEKASANLTNGVLTITLPKAAEVQPRRIEVRSA